jgi:hypothetical protein
MRGSWDNRDMRGLEGRTFWPRLDHHFSNPFENPSLEKLFQLLWICIKLYQKPWPYRAPVPISSSPIILAMASSVEEAHSCMKSLLATSFLNKAYMKSL